MGESQLLSSRRLFPTLVVIFALLACQPTAAQHTTSEFYKETFGVLFRLEPNGSLKQSGYSSGNVLDCDIDAVRLLNSPVVQNELALSDDQKQQLSELTKKQEADLRRFAELSSQSQTFNQSEFKQLQEIVDAIKSECLDATESVLLPHQIERFLELRIRFELRKHGLYSSLTKAPLRSHLEITDKQIRQFDLLAKTISKELP